MGLFSPTADSIPPCRILVKPTTMEKHAHSPEVVTSLPLSSTGRCLARSSEVGSQKEAQMSFAIARPALAGTHYLQMKKIRDWQCLRDDFPSLVVELVGAGFLCPLIWYIAALLYYCKYYNRDPRERPGLAASAFLAVIFTAATIVTLSVLLIMCTQKRLNSCACPS
uniref:Uncharacterized protein n=1 Tax=Oryza punctata TaxID=4537 RepID=A0A0E0KZ81_ORYPU